MSEKERAWLTASGAIFRALDAVRDLAEIADEEDKPTLKSVRFLLERAHRAMR